MTLNYIADGIAACIRVEVSLAVHGEPEDSLLNRKVRKAKKTLEEAGEIIRIKEGTHHLSKPAARYLRNDSGDYVEL